MKKEFKKPELIVVLFEEEDIITYSGGSEEGADEGSITIPIP